MFGYIPTVVAVVVVQVKDFFVDEDSFDLSY